MSKHGGFNQLIYSHTPMTSAYILITAILVLGGLIAALGDRLGTKVGKARLRLFNLRPRQTAMVVTVLTGTAIASLTLGILFSLSESLRQGVFDLDDILRKRRAVERELEIVTNEKEQVESELETVTEEKEQTQSELDQSKLQQYQAQNRLDQINEDFKKAQEQLKAISGQAQQLRSDIRTLLGERQQLQQQRLQLKAQTAQLQTQVQQLRGQLQQQDRELAGLKQEAAEQNAILNQQEIQLQQLETQQQRLRAEVARRDDVITGLDRAIATKDQQLAVRESRLNQLESQLTFLKGEVEELEQYYQIYQDLRARQIALLRGQVLAFATVRIIDPNAVTPVIDQLLNQANRQAIQIVSGEDTVDRRVIMITKAQVEQIRAQLQDGQEYVVRILSAGNYVQGEDEVRVFADVAPNQKVFNSGETIATVSVDAEAMSEAAIQQRLDLLLSASQFRARRAGVLGEIQIEDGLTNLVGFIEQINESEQPPEEIKAVASDATYTAGPLKLSFVALRNGKVVFST